MYRRFFKRFLDFWIALIALVCLSPVLLCVAILLYFANEGAGVFFLQERPGLHNKVFKVIKFKTMNDKCDANGELLPNKERLTRVGRVVRASSIDELPQLINVLKGDMALIGPRPLLTWFLPLYDEEQIRRHEVRPGITGWAQVHGRNMTLYSEKFKYDVWYVDHLSFALDCRIILMTIKNVISSKNIGNGLQNEVDDLRWSEKKTEAERIYIEKYKNNS